MIAAGRLLPAASTPAVQPSSSAPKLDERWQAKYRAKYAELCSSIAKSGTISEPATSRSSDADTQHPDASTSTQHPPPTTREQQLAEQMHEYVTEEVRDALARLRRHGPLSPIRWLLGTLASTASFQNPLPFTGMSLLFHASRAAEALGFDQLDHVLPYGGVGRDWGAAAAQHLLAPRGLALLHSVCTPAFQLLNQFDDPLVVNALFRGFGLSVIAARHVLDGLIARRSVRHVLQVVEAAAVERHMEWVRARLLKGPASDVVAIVGEASGEVAAAST